LNIKQEFIRPNQYTRPGLPLRRVTAIAIHYTGDPGATAQNERDYFNGPCISAGRYASCHYCVGMDGKIIQLIPEREWAYCTCQANAYSISIETCHPDSSGRFTEAAEKSLIELAASLCKKYGLNPLHGGVIRHYDVTRKECPFYYVTHPACWETFKQSVSNCMAGRPYVLPCSGKEIIEYHVDPNYCDTHGTLVRALGMAYTFKTGAPIACAGGAAAPFKQVGHYVSNGYHYTTFEAVKETDGVGFYSNDKRVCIGKIVPAQCDTARVTKHIGQMYQFKSNVPLVCGNTSIWRQVAVKLSKDGYFYTKFKAVGHGSAGFYCGKRVAIGTVI